MTATVTSIVSGVHTGQCHAPRATAAEAPGRGYCLHDPSGRPVGTIPAPVTRPVLGKSAPTFYLRRD